MYGSEFHLWEKCDVMYKHNICVLLYIKSINTPQMSQLEGCAYVVPRHTQSIFVAM